MKSINWRTSLALVQVVLALVLLVAGHFEERAHRTEMQQQVRPGWESKSEWDYIPRARIWLMTIDSPPY